MSEKIILTDTQGAGAGALVYWRLSGALDVRKLAEAWEAAGLPAKYLPDPPAPPTALARAVATCRGAHTLTRALADRGGHAVVHETAEANDLNYTVGCKVKLDAIGRPKFDPAEHPLRDTITARFEIMLNECSPEDVSAWLTRVVLRESNAVALRDTGGVYYIPPHGVEIWDRMTGALSAVSAHRAFSIPALRSDSAIDAILDAIEQEAQREVDRMTEELAKGLGSRAIVTRLSRCDAVENKVAGYEGFLGKRLDSMRGKLEEVRAQFVAAQLAAEAEEDAA